MDTLKSFSGPVPGQVTPAILETDRPRQIIQGRGSLALVLHHVRTALVATFLSALAILVAGGSAGAAPAGCGGEPETIVGSVVAIASSIRQDGTGASESPSLSFLIRTSDDRAGLVNVTLVGDAQVTGADGRSTAPGEIGLSARVRVCGRYAGPMQFEATSIELLP